MLDLNYVRENIDKVRAALEARRADTTALADFSRADEERRRAIGESDKLNAERNASSREIGALMKEGKKDEAEARRAEVGRLKDRIAELDQMRAQTETRMHDLLSTLPNIPHASVPVGTDESSNVEVRRWGASGARAHQFHARRADTRAWLSRNPATVHRQSYCAFRHRAVAEV